MFYKGRERAGRKMKGDTGSQKESDKGGAVSVSTELSCGKHVRPTSHVVHTHLPLGPGCAKYAVLAHPSRILPGTL